MRGRRKSRWGACQAIGLCAAIAAVLAPAATAQREPVLPRAPEVEAPPPAAPSDVQSTEDKSPLPARDGSHWFIYDEAIELTVLADLSTHALGLHLVFDRAKLEGKVAIDRPGAYTSDELWDLFNRELQARGLATIQAPGNSGVQVVAVADAAGMARVESMELGGARAGYVKLVRSLEHRKGEDLVETVKLLLSKSGGQVSAVRDANALVIADFRPHVVQALDVLDLLDFPDAAPSTIEVPLANVTPLAMGTLIERVVNARKALGLALQGIAMPLAESESILVVAPISEAAWWRETIAAFDRPEPSTTLHYTPRRFGLAETARLIEATVRGDASAPGAWKMVEDGLTGTLIITTTPKRHAAVQALLTRLNETAEGPRKPLRAFPIKNRRVSEVLGLLEDLLDAGVLAQPVADVPAAQPPVQGATGAIRQQATQISALRKADAVTLAADEATNRILAFGEASMLDQLARLIEQVDAREAQVLVEALVVTLTESQTRSLGVELQRIGTSGDTSARFASLFGLGSVDPAGSTLPATTAAGFSTAILNPGDFSAVVRALETINQGRTLTIPKVLVNNNVQASLDSTLQTPYASTNASSTVATTSFGGTLDAGTRVTVKPQVADGDQVVMAYSVSLSTFTGAAASANVPPPRQENRLESVVTVPDGFTVVVGGLEIESEGEDESRVPWLGRVPLLGNLFKARSRTGSKSRFFVFLRCSVMRNAGFEDLKYVSAEALDEAGLDDGWPVLEPRVIR